MCTWEVVAPPPFHPTTHSPTLIRPPLLPIAQVYAYIQRGLFERHKLVFSLMTANRIGVAASTIKQVCVCARLCLQEVGGCVGWVVVVVAISMME